MLHGPLFIDPFADKLARARFPWLLYTDAPREMAERLGWSATVTDVAEQGNNWNRWDAPATPMGLPDVPRGYFVEATR